MPALLMRKSLVARIEDAGGEAAYVRTDVKRREDLSEPVKLACLHWAIDHVRRLGFVAGGEHCAK